jgi:hypothetical protein
MKKVDISTARNMTRYYRNLKSLFDYKMYMNQLICLYNPRDGVVLSTTLEDHECDNEINHVIEF